MPGPPSPGTPKILANGGLKSSHGNGGHQKITALSASEIVGAATSAAEGAPGFTNFIHGPWVVLTTAIGISGPQHITDLKNTTRALRRYGG